MKLKSAILLAVSMFLAIFSLTGCQEKLQYVHGQGNTRSEGWIYQKRTFKADYEAMNSDIERTFKINRPSKLSPFYQTRQQYNY